VGKLRHGGVPHGRGHALAAVDLAKHGVECIAVQPIGRQHLIFDRLQVLQTFVQEQLSVALHVHG
jgi:hypothetical protein